MTTRVKLLLLCSLAMLVPACYQKMAVQPSYHPLQPSDFFTDGRSSRPVVPGTVARGQLRIDHALYQGTDKDDKLVTEFPFEMTKKVLERGQQRYTIFCSVCHGLTGHGDGRIVQRGFTKPPSYTLDYARGYPPEKDLPEDKRVKLTDVPVGYIYQVITKGYGAMPDHAEQIPVKDRWAIVGYVKALQYAQLPELRKTMKLAPKGGNK